MNICFGYIFFVIFVAKNITCYKKKRVDYGDKARYTFAKAGIT